MRRSTKRRIQVTLLLLAVAIGLMISIAGTALARS
jgi:hypothetical protein